MKRIFDIILSCILLIIFSPLIIAVAILIRIGMGAPLLFIQERPGKNEIPFKMYKFRTMLSITEDSGKSSPDNKRITRLGHIMRSLSLDELPELWNVLKGEMSLVGPRPLLMEYLELYTPEQARRHGVKPGITGWAQVNGRNAIDWDERFKLDVWYVDNLSFWLDIKIILLTVYKVLIRENVNKNNHTTMEPFKGIKLND